MTQTTTPAARPSTANAERAARDVANRYVREGLVSRQVANQVLKFALPFVPSVLADKRRKGWSVEEIREHFQGKLAVAEKSGKTNDRLSVEIYLAMWEGLQADYAVYRAALEG